MSETARGHACLFCGEEFSETGDLYMHAGRVHLRSRDDC